MADFTIGQGDTGAPLAAVLSDASGPYSLAGCAVTFHMVNRRDGSVMVNRLASPDPDQTAHPGRVVVNWLPGETDTAGDYLAEFQVLINGTTPVTFPDSDQKILIHVAPKLA